MNSIANIIFDFIGECENRKSKNIIINICIDEKYLFFKIIDDGEKIVYSNNLRNKLISEILDLSNGSYYIIDSIEANQQNLIFDLSNYNTLPIGRICRNAFLLCPKSDIRIELYSKHIKKKRYLEDISNAMFFDDVILEMINEELERFDINARYI